MSMKPHTSDAVRADNGFSATTHRRSATHALVATAREPMAVLDRDFRVTAANRAYHNLFPANNPLPIGQPFCQPDPPSWIAAIHHTLENVVACDLVADDIEVDLDVPGIGMRRLLINARRIGDRVNPGDCIAVGLTDITDLRLVEQLAGAAADRHAMLLQEAHHRIANSLQIVASILLLKARTVDSEETRAHLRDVHKRLILVATVQRQLCSSGMLEEVEFGPYVAELCKGLSESMIDDDSEVAILTSATAGKIKADDAVSFGLIVTELVLNALKHAFPGERRGLIAVDFAANEKGWRLTVSDDGVGKPVEEGATRVGLGTTIVEALARHLKAHVEVAKPAIGSSISIVHSRPNA